MDMGTYDHGLQVNKIEKTEESDTTEVSISITEKQVAVALTGISVENGSRPMKFLQRVIKSLLRQMNVQSHTFGPGEAITIDLQSEIKYNDYVILHKFVNAEEHEEPDKHLNRVDEIMSNLIHVVEHTSSRYEFMESIFNLPIFCSLKFWLVMITMSVICFLIIMLSVRTVYAANNISMLFYGFLIIFILSCIWTFSFMYEDAKAVKYAKLIQSQAPPKDCEYNNLNTRESVLYFFRVQLFGYKDQCEQYYSNTMNDPFWSVNPLEAISRSFMVLIFSPSDYVGRKLGQFFGGIMAAIPFWLQPLLVLLIFGFTFMSLFGYRVVSPFLTIEPARRQYLDRNPTSGPAITDRVKNELMEKPDQKIMKSVKNAETDMDGFDEHLQDQFGEGERGTDERNTNRGSMRTRIVQYGCWLWRIVIRVLDTLFLQCPSTSTNTQNQNEEDSFDFEIPREPQNAGAADDDEQEDFPRRRRRIEIENVFIPRRRAHIGLEQGSEDCADKENIKPCTSSSLTANKNISSVFVTTEEACYPNSESSGDEDD